MNNRVRLKGNLGSDPDFRRTKDGKEVANLSIGVTDRYYDYKTKEWKDEPVQWFKAAVLKALPLYECKHLKKGSLVNIEGKIKSAEYVDNKGITRTSLEIIVSSIEEIVRRKSK